MHPHTTLATAALTALFAFTGCSTPRHTDMLVFGTNTEIGVSVKGDASSTTGASIGFQRQEVVLMPLYVNAVHSKLTAPTPAQMSDPKYVGSDTDARKDTYSVLASFGAKGSGSTKDGAGVTIAQYFATGLAARTLALAGGALVTTSDAAAARPITAEVIDAEKSAEIRSSAMQRNEQIEQIVGKIADPDTGKVDQTRLKKALDGIAGAPNAAGLAKITSRELLRAELNLPQYRGQLEQILKNASS